LTGLAGLGVPRLLGIEVLAKYGRPSDPRWDLFGVGLALDYLPSKILFFGSDTTVSLLQLGVQARWFPWRFVFVGASGGYQVAQADSTKFGSAVNYSTLAAFVTPRAGILYTLPSGITFGGDLGAAIPFAATTHLNTDQEDSNARKAVKTLGMFVDPQINLRFGYTLGL
jgi:hypothetical protein